MWKTGTGEFPDQYDLARWELERLQNVNLKTTKLIVRVSIITMIVITICLAVLGLNYI